MSSPVGYPQGNSLKMFTDGTYGAGDIPVGVPGKNLTPLYATSSDGGNGFDETGRRALRGTGVLSREYPNRRLT